MFNRIKVQLDMFDEGLIDETKLASWLRFHVWVNQK